MPDKKISDLLNNPNPGPDTATVPLIESAEVGGSTVFTNYRTSVKSIVVSGLNAADTSVDGGNF